MKTILDTPVKINGVYSVHYFEYAKDFAYSGEIHDFWEIVYADKKRLLITAGAKEIELEVGQLYIHRPNEFHNIRCDGKRAANSVILTFDCDCPDLMSIAGIVITCGAEERKLIGNIINEAQSAFSNPLGLAYTTVMKKSLSGDFGCEQLIKLYLEQLVILLIRGNERAYIPAKSENNFMLKQICDYLEKNVERTLNFQDVITEFNISASALKRIFREQMNCGVMEYFSKLKIDAAKQMIREQQYNFTEIASALNFNSSQYFTTVFRRISGMTPSEYANSVKSIYIENGDYHG